MHAHKLDTFVNMLSSLELNDKQTDELFKKINNKFSKFEQNPGYLNCFHQKVELTLVFQNGK